MYKIISKLESVLMYDCDNDLIALIDRKNRNLKVYNNLIEKWRTNERNHNCFIINKKIITNNIRIYNIDGSVIYKNSDYQDYSFEILDYETKNSLWKTIDYEKEKALYHLFDCSQYNMIFDNIDLDIAIPVILLKDIIIAKETGNIYLYNSSELIWKKNLGEEAKYIHWDGQEKKGEIKNIYHQDNNILVLTTCYLISLDFQGNLIYKTRFPDLLRAQTLVINKALGYIYNYHDFIIIDLATGEIIFHKEIKSFEYKNEEFNNFAQDLIYNEGLLFHSVTSRGLSFIVAINSETGETIWRKHITNQSISTISFHQKNMFVLDGGSTLHIFEKTVEI